jgi:hypothetical protein
MTKLFKLVVNCETGVKKEVELTAEEIAEIETARQINAQKEFEAEAKAEAKAVAQAKLEALGLTVEDLTALGL